MEALTINEAARTTGWSPRMLRYIERAGLLVLRRSPGGYRLYGPEQLQRLRTLRELLDRFGFGLAELGFARRLRTEPALARAVDDWFETEPARPEFVAPTTGCAGSRRSTRRCSPPPPPPPQLETA